MQRHRVTITLTVTTLLAAGILSCALYAQERRALTDLRGGNFTADDLAKALFPDPEPATRGVRPQQLEQPQQAQQPSVALNVLFEFNADKIRRDFYPDLEKLGQVLTRPQYAEYRLQIEGHTDGIGSDRYNQLLSERRAESIKRYLLEHFSLPPDRLIAKGYGKSRPVTTNETDEGRSKNRRVEIVNLGK